MSCQPDSVVGDFRFAFLIQETPFFATHVMKVMADRLRTMDLRLAA